LTQIATPAVGQEYLMNTPRSVQTTHDYQSPFSMIQTPPIHPSPQSSPRGSDWVGIILPSTFSDYNEWISTNVGDGLGNAKRDSRQVADPTTAPDKVFHTETRLKDGRPAVLIDPGSVGNLGGSAWARSVATTAISHGRKPDQKRRDCPLNVSGVGNGSQMCTHNCTLPVAFKRTDGTHSRGTFQVPVVDNSDLPGLLGLQSMRDRDAILDMKTLQLHFAGPGDYNLTQHLPPGTETFQCEIAPSGHLVLPCCEYKGVDREEAGRLDTGPQLALTATHSE